MSPLACQLVSRRAWNLRQRSAENNLLTVVGDSAEFKPATKATTTAILAGHEARAHTGVLNENCVSPHLRL